MIKVDEIKKIVKLALLSGFIKNMKPLSLMLVATPGSGKTEIITTYTSPSLTFETDLNYSGLISSLIKKKGIKHVIVPDFIKITHKKQSTSMNLISLFNSAVEDGLYELNGYFKHNFKGRRIGLITSTTPASMAQTREQWTSIGFIDRMIKCSYEYSDDTKDIIIKSVNEELEHIKETEKLKCDIVKGIMDKKQLINIKTNVKFNSQLNELLGKSKKIRKLKQLQSLLKCNALFHGRNKVLQIDVDEIKDLNKYLNFYKCKI